MRGKVKEKIRETGAKSHVNPREPTQSLRETQVLHQRASEPEFTAGNRLESEFFWTLTITNLPNPLPCLIFPHRRHHTSPVARPFVLVG